MGVERVPIRNLTLGPLVSRSSFASLIHSRGGQDGSGGAEQNDPVWLGNLDDAPNYLVCGCVVGSAVLSYVLSCGCHGVSESVWVNGL